MPRFSPTPESPDSPHDIELILPLLLKDLSNNSGISTLIRSRARFDSYARIRITELLETFGQVVSANVPAVETGDGHPLSLGWLPERSSGVNMATGEHATVAGIGRSGAGKSWNHVSVAEILTLNTWYRHPEFQNEKRSISETDKALTQGLEALLRSTVSHAHLLAVLYPADLRNTRFEQFLARHEDECDRLAKENGWVASDPARRRHPFAFKPLHPGEELPGIVLHTRFTRPEADGSALSDLAQYWYFPPRDDHQPRLGSSAATQPASWPSDDRPDDTHEREEGAVERRAYQRVFRPLEVGSSRHRIRSVLPPHAYRDSLRAIRDRMRDGGQVLTMREICNLFEKEVRKRIEAVLATRWLREHPDLRLAPQADVPEAAGHDSSDMVVSEHPEARYHRIVKQTPTLASRLEQLIEAFDSGGSGSKYMKVHLHTVNSRLRLSFKMSVDIDAPTDSPDNYNFFAFLDSGEESNEGRLAYLERPMAVFDPADPRQADIRIYHRKNEQGEPLSVSAAEVLAALEARSEDRGSSKARIAQDVPGERAARSVLDSGTAEGLATKGSTSPMTIASRIWVAMALLHKKHPDTGEFTLKQIRSKLAELFYNGDPGRFESGIATHLSGHLVSNAPKHGVNKCYLVSVDRGLRRLYRTGESCHESRISADIRPDPSELTPEWHSLLTWYDQVYSGSEFRA